MGIPNRGGRARVYLCGVATNEPRAPIQPKPATNLAAAAADGLELPKIDAKSFPATVWTRVNQAGKPGFSAVWIRFRTLNSVIRAGAA